MMTKIHKKLNVEIPIMEIFKVSTIEGLAAYIDSLEEGAYQEIQPVEERDYYEMSSAQRRMYLQQEMDRNSISNNMTGVMELEGEIDVLKLQDTFIKLIKRHDSFRTSFKTIEGKPVQIIHKDVEFAMEYRETSTEEIDGILKEFIRPFDLQKAPLLRVGLIRLDNGKYILQYDMHHIISDGLSKAILVKEFASLYQGEILPDLKLQYKDYSHWQNMLLMSDKMKKQEAYWLDVFNGEIPVLNMPTDFQRTKIKTIDGDMVEFEIGKELTSKLKNIVKETRTTLYMLLLAGYNVLLSKYSGQEDIIIGSPIAGRVHGDLDNIIGMFINTLAMRNYPVAEKTFKEFLMEVKDNVLQAYENQHYQFEELVEKLSLSRDLSRSPLFDVVFLMQNIEVKELTLPNIKIKHLGIDITTSEFDMLLTAVENDETVSLTMQYCTALYKKETMESIVTSYIEVLERVVEDIDKPLIKLSPNSNIIVAEVVEEDDVDFDF